MTTGKVHLTFANTPPGVSPIGESPLYFRQYIRGLSPLANVLLAKVLLANVPPPLLDAILFKPRIIILNVDLYIICVEFIQFDYDEFMISEILVRVMISKVEW